jgi:hypothetical protein
MSYVSFRDFEEARLLKYLKSMAKETSSSCYWLTVIRPGRILQDDSMTASQTSQEIREEYVLSWHPSYVHTIYNNKWPYRPQGEKV